MTLRIIRLLIRIPFLLIMAPCILAAAVICWAFDGEFPDWVVAWFREWTPLHD